MSDLGNFQNRVRNTIGSGFNFQVDRPHADKREHVDLTVKIPGVGADKVSVDFYGNVIGSATHVGPVKMKW